MIVDTPTSETQTSARFDAALLRASTYSLLARLLRFPPDTELLALLSNIEAETQAQTALEVGWHQLKQSAAHTRLADLDDEFHAVFIGLGHGEVIPYGSWYQTGYLMDKPLARLRQDLRVLGLERQDQVSEPEDHIAAVCECMALLIDNGADLKTQQDFFREHMHGWLARCFNDIGQAPSARFYRAVAQLGQQFAELEARYLDVLDA
jgi:TorA maturation chaperone TorD